MTHYIQYRGHTAELNKHWQNVPGRVVCRGREKNRNVLIETALGRVVVPGRNVRRLREGEHYDPDLRQLRSVESPGYEAHQPGILPAADERC